MTRLYVFCEGASEREFVKQILYEYLCKYGIEAIPIDAKHKAGISSYDKIKHELSRICANHKNEYVTTMFDYYGLPKGTPMIESGDIELIEHSIKESISADNLTVYLSKHEFEALLFSDVACFERLFPESSIILGRVRSDYSTPEDINNSENTAPSKRILNVIPDYVKTTDGLTIAKLIGIEKMISECPHFRWWINHLINTCKTNP